MPDRLIIIRQPSHIRNVTDAEVRNVLPGELIRLPVDEVVVDMRPFANDIAGGYWDESEGFLIQKAQEIRAFADAATDPALIYFGLAEVPHIIALGAYIGDERHVLVHDFDRDRASWMWSEQRQTLDVKVFGLPDDRVSITGDIVLRVAVSYQVHDKDVDDVIEESRRLADVSVAIQNSLPTAVQSTADYAKAREQDDQNARWYSYFLFNAEVAPSNPFPMLPPLWELVNPNSSVDPSPLISTEPYALPKSGWAWQLTDRLLLSHWAFVDGGNRVVRWQVRHVRRFLNWYWRLVQVVHAPSLDIAVRTLSTPPAIEIAGREQEVGGRRVYVRLDRDDPTTDLSLGLVAENAMLVRIVDSTNANLRELLRAFSERNHEAIKTFFQTVYEEADAVNGALPSF